MNQTRPTCSGDYITMIAMKIIFTPGLFVTRIWDTNEHDYTDFVVSKFHNKINYVNKKLSEKNGFEELHEDYNIYIQTGMPIDIYS